MQPLVNAEVGGRMVRVSQRISIAYFQELWAGVSRRRVSGRTYKSLLRKTKSFIRRALTPRHWVRLYTFVLIPSPHGLELEACETLSTRVG